MTEKSAKTNDDGQIATTMDNPMDVYVWVLGGYDFTTTNLNNEGLSSCPSTRADPASFIVGIKPTNIYLPNAYGGPGGQMMQ